MHYPVSPVERYVMHGIFELDAMKEQYKGLADALVSRLRAAMPGEIMLPGGLDFTGSYTPHKGPYVGQALPATVHVDTFDGEKVSGRISISNLFDDAQFTMSVKKGRLEGSVPAGPITYTIQADLRSVRPVLSHRPPSLRMEGALFMEENHLGDIVLYFPLSQLSRLWHH